VEDEEEARPLSRERGILRAFPDENQKGDMSIRIGGSRLKAQHEAKKRTQQKSHDQLNNTWGTPKGEKEKEDVSN